MAQEPRSLSIKESFRRKNVTKYQKLRYLFKGMFKATPPDRKWQICFLVVVKKNVSLFLSFSRQPLTPQFSIFNINMESGERR